MDSPGPVAYRRAMDEHTGDPTVPDPDRGNPTGGPPGAGRWGHDTLRRAGVHAGRLYDPGEYHESNDRFDDVGPGVNDPYRQVIQFEPLATGP